MEAYSKIKVSIGFKYFHWTIINIISAGRIVVRCNCGHETEHRQTDILRERSRRCQKCHIQSLHKTLIKEGDIFGKWKVISNKHDYVFYNNKPVEKKWLCRCQCGTEQYIRTSHLTGKRSNSCVQCAIDSKKSFIGEISSWILNKAKEGAKQRNHVWNITDEYLWDLFLKQKRKCALSGVQLSFSKESGGTKRGRAETTASLDRINSKKGYVEGNVQWVHKVVNMMKNDSLDQEFIKWCKIISKYNNLKK